MNIGQFYEFSSFCANVNAEERISIILNRINLKDGTCIEINNNDKVMIHPYYIKIYVLIKDDYIKIYPDEIKDIKFKFVTCKNKNNTSRDIDDIIYEYAKTYIHNKEHKECRDRVVKLMKDNKMYYPNKVDKLKHAYCSAYLSYCIPIGIIGGIVNINKDRF